MLTGRGFKRRESLKCAASGRQICVDTVLDSVLDLMRGLGLHFFQYVAEENGH